MLVKPVSVEVYEDPWSNSRIVTYEQTGMEKLLVYMCNFLLHTCHKEVYCYHVDCIAVEMALT
jgi:hypothetical protein